MSGAWIEYIEYIAHIIDAQCMLDHKPQDQHSNAVITQWRITYGLNLSNTVFSEYVSACILPAWLYAVFGGVAYIIY